MGRNRLKENIQNIYRMSAILAIAMEDWRTDPNLVMGLYIYIPRLIDRKSVV